MVARLQRRLLALGNSPIGLATSLDVRALGSLIRERILFGGTHGIWRSPDLGDRSAKIGEPGQHGVVLIFQRYG